MSRILVCDDHPIVRKGLCQILATLGDEVEIDEAHNGEEAIEMAVNNDYNIVLLDISLPDISGLSVLNKLKKKKIKMPVLMLSIFPEEMYAIKAFKMGANGYLTKKSAPGELLNAVKKVMSGGKYISSSLAELLVNDVGGVYGELENKELSDREFQVMGLITSGKKPGEIAEELNLSVRTISTYRVRILKKLKLKSNAELIQYVMQNRMLGWE